jgi:four helix bundle protein
MNNHNLDMIMQLMFTNSILVEKALAFSVNIVRVALELRKNFGEYDLSSQILSSGTSIGANITEAKVGSSRKDYIAKLKIARKEYYETVYWLELLRRCDYIKTSDFQKLDEELTQIGKLLNSWLKPRT